MTREAIQRYIDKTLEAYLNDETKYVHAVEHLIGIVVTSQPDFDGYDSPRTRVLYFVSNYLVATVRRDAVGDESSDLQSLTTEDIEILSEYVVQHKLFHSAYLRFSVEHGA